MQTWMKDFLERVLDPVPDPAYRRRLEQELTDHLAALCGDLEGAGYTPEEARAAALERMGDPEELARRCEEQWRQRLRSPRYRAARLGRFLNLVCYLICMAVVGVLYIVNAPNFGKAVVGIYGLAAIPMAAVLLVVLAVDRQGGGWAALRLGCWGFALMQGPPLLCWLSFGSPGFEMSGVFVSGFAGLTAHVLILVWSIWNGSMLEQASFHTAL